MPQHPSPQPPETRAKLAGMSNDMHLYLPAYPVRRGREVRHWSPLEVPEAKFWRWLFTRESSSKDSNPYLMGVVFQESKPCSKDSCNGWHRTLDSFQSRNWITLDADKADGDYLDRVSSVLRQLTDGPEGERMANWHTTHSHTAEAPRYRVMIPLSRLLDAQTFGKVARTLVTAIGAEYHDVPASVTAVQPVYAPPSGCAYGKLTR